MITLLILALVIIFALGIASLFIEEPEPPYRPRRDPE